MCPACPTIGKSTSGRWSAPLIILLLGLHALLAGWMAARNSPAGDELAHIAAGVSYWENGTFSLYNVNPPLVKLIAAAPVVLCRPETESLRAYGPTSRPEFRAGRQFVVLNPERSFWHVMLARWACIPLSLIGGWVCYRWAADLYGPAAGISALALWCLSPSVLAFSSCVTCDLGAAALGVLAGYCFWRWLKQPSPVNMLAAGLAFGLAQLTKTTWIVLFALWPVLWLLWERSDRRGARSGTWRSRAGHLTLILFIGLDVLNLGYLFEGSFRPLGDYTFVSRALAAEESPAEGGDGGNRFAQSRLGEVPVPLPQNYIAGIDLQKLNFDNVSWSYMAGEWHHGGRWWYYLYAAGVKVPLGTWLLAVLALAATLWSVGRRKSAQRWGREGEASGYWAGWRNELTLVLPAITVFGLVSSQTGFSHHFRYVVPCLPFALIWISKVARSIELGHRAPAALGGLALAWTVGSSLWVYPHSLSYFNELAGGPRRGHYHLLNSNIDWGQDLLRFKEWHDAHPEARPLFVNVDHSFDLKHYGLDYPEPPTGPTRNKRSQDTATHIRHRQTAADVRAMGPQPGWHALRVNQLHNRHGGYDYFLDHFEPAEMIGYSIYIYHITPDAANRARRDLGLPAIEAQR